MPIGRAVPIERVVRTELVVPTGWVVPIERVVLTGWGCGPSGKTANEFRVERS